MSPCDSLPPGHREICEGTSGHKPHKRHAYMMLFLRQGSIDRLPDGYEPPDDMPPITSQAKNLAGAVGRSVTAGVKGEAVKVSREVRDERHAICLACVRRHEKRCLECGCWLTAKQWSATEDCPIGKWPPTGPHDR